MMKIWFLAITIVCFSIPEFWLGSLGFIVPLSIVPVYFAVTAYGWFSGAVCAICSGVWLDMIYGRDFPSTLVAFLLLVLVVWIFLRDRGIVEVEEAISSIIFSALAVEFIMGLSEYSFLGFSLYSSVMFVLQIIWHSFLGGVFIFLGYSVLVTFSDKLGIERIVQAAMVKKGPEFWHFR